MRSAPLVNSLAVSSSHSNSAGPCQSFGGSGAPTAPGSSVPDGDEGAGCEQSRDRVAVHGVLTTRYIDAIVYWHESAGESSSNAPGKGRNP
jgi:hypothetical protein